MDSDCLIKLTNAEAKELACSKSAITITGLIKCEVVDNACNRPDAMAIERNIRKGLITVSEFDAAPDSKGENSVLALFEQGGYDAVCSDDRRFLAKVRALGIPYLTPASLLVVAANTGTVRYSEARRLLDNLAPFVSPEEYAIAKITLQEEKDREG